MDDKNNPYAPPRADLAPLPDEPEFSALATRGSRFGAALLDGLILMVVVLPVQYALGFFDGFPNIVEPDFSMQLIAAAVGIAAYALINGKFLAENGQTLGKKALGIRIVNMDDTKPSLADIVIKRYTPFTAMALVPGIGSVLGLVNALLIFGAAHRCGHDLIAGTKVVMA